ncbi:uncharacterized protein CBL_10229 [Carabus blaptoides fortunei]
MLRTFLSNSKIPFIQNLRSKEICYDTVGCFDIPRRHNPLRQAPEHPGVLETQFYLFRRDINFSSPELLTYSNSDQSLQGSTFNVKQPVKILVHGYMTKWDEPGALAGAKAYLKIEDCNMILVNWEKGARGPRYGTAAANTELVGRQLGLLLLGMISLGVHPTQVHIIGFSLGAHVAACASEQLKDRGHLIDRITGLDPASPLFKLNHFRDKRKKLDVTDARYVDVIHTDGSPVFTDGFGLLEPVGHVDFFPNGGREQPGCNDVKGSVVVSHFEKSLDRDIACSHVRAYYIFLETLLQQASGTAGCQFIAYQCPKGPRDFAMGHCYPVNNNMSVLDTVASSLGVLGERSFGTGPMYLVTKAVPPYCGSQLQVSVQVSPLTKPSRGILFLTIDHGNHTTDFQIHCEIVDMIVHGRELNSLAAAEYGSIDSNMEEMTATIYYTKLHQADGQTSRRNLLFIDGITIRDLNSNSWQNCDNIIISPDVINNLKVSIVCISTADSESSESKQTPCSWLSSNLSKHHQDLSATKFSGAK